MQLTLLAPLVGPGAPCRWCTGAIPDVSPTTGRRTRRDAVHCDVACRQADHRNQRKVGKPATPAPTAGPMRLAYADPPYPGMAHLYQGHGDYAGEVDHGELIRRLLREFPDGWALSTSSKTLRDVLALVPPEAHVRIGAWTKPMPPRKAYRARTAWEPVLFCGGRPTLAWDLLDWIHAAPPRNQPGQLVGIKPAAFSGWVFRSLGAQPGDDLVDLFPGSGAVGRAWAAYVDEREASVAAAAAARDASAGSPRRVR